MNNSTSGSLDAPPQRRRVLLLAGFAAIAPLSIDLFLPGVPALRAELNVSPEPTAATLSLFFIGLAVGQLVAGPLLLAGHSMGGRVALEAFRLAPARIRGLALLDTGYQPLPAGEPGLLERDGRLRLLDLARREGMRAMAHEWLRRMVHPRRLDDAPLIEAISAMFARRTPEHLEAQVRALLQRPDAGPLLNEIRCPTLLLCGEQDLQAPPSQHRAMHERIVGSSLLVLPECGHMAPMENPPAVADALRRWLGQAMAA